MSKNFGQYLRKLRKNRGLTLKELGELTGMSHAYLSQLERGERGVNGIPAPDTLRKLSVPLKVQFFELMVEAGHITEEEWNEAFIQEGFHVDDDVVYNRVLLNQESPWQDLKQLLENKNSLTYNGWDLMDDQREQILNMLAILLPTYAKEKREPQ